MGLSAQLLEKNWLRMMKHLTQGAGVWRRGKRKQTCINEVRQDNKDLETQAHVRVYAEDNKHWKITLGSPIRKRHEESSYFDSVMAYMGFPCGSVVKNLPAKTGDAGSIPGLGRSPQIGNGNPLQYACWENPMDRGAWEIYSPQGHNQSDTV